MKLLTFWVQIIMWQGVGVGSGLCIVGHLVASLVYPLDARNPHSSPPTLSTFYRIFYM